MTSLHVLGVGNALVDVLTHADDAFIASHGLARGAATMVDETTAARVYDALPPAIEMSGGSAANTIAGLASFGAATGYLGRVRDDELGDVFGHDLRSLGVRFDARPAVEGPPTGRCLVMVTSDAQRTMCTYLGVSSDFGPDDVDDALVADAAVVYLEGYLWDQPAAKEAIRRVARVAHEAGRQVAFTLSDPFCVGRHRAEFLHLVEHEIDVLFANEIEICSLYEVEEFDEALQRVRPHCDVAALTRSEKGSVILRGDEVHVIDPAPVAAVVDTTGAGDLYAAGVLYGLTHGHDLGTCGHLGSLAAAEVIGHLGARPEQSLADLARPLLG
ncbi:MAG: adenosine kinase [Acidimicrobiia bacterium]